MIQIDDKETEVIASALQLKSRDIARRMDQKGAKQYRTGMVLELEACKKLIDRLDESLEKIPALSAVK